MSVKRGQRLNTKQKLAAPSPGSDAELAQFVADTRRLVAHLEKSSPLKDVHAKRVLCEALATLRVTMRDLLLKQASRTASVDEVRIIPSVASNIRRIVESLELTGVEEPDAGGLL
jgi:hypothetical protein